MSRWRAPLVAAMLAATLALASCKTAGEPEVRTVTAYVDRPVACVKEAEKPALPAQLEPRPSSIRAALDLAVAKIREWEIFGSKAKPLLDRCSKAP